VPGWGAYSQEFPPSTGRGATLSGESKPACNTATVEFDDSGKYPTATRCPPARNALCAVARSRPCDVEDVNAWERNPGTTR
jgi:hypothetical protein